MKRNLVIVGGGSAGWMAALFINKYYNHCFNITVIESTNIGILGAGEGVTPGCADFFLDIGIGVTELAKYADLTLKNGIKFTNWNNDNTYFYHTFKEHFTPWDTYGILHYPILVLDQMASGKSLDEIMLSSKASDAYKGKVIRKYEAKFNQPKGFHYNNFGTLAHHFNAKKLAGYLKQVGEKRQISILDAIVKSANRDENGYFTELVLDNGSTVACDFVIDCTGFYRLFVDKLLNSKWKSHAKNLKINSAIPVFLDMKPEEKTPPYTECISLKYGWMWKLPAGRRFGCGYAFDSDLISDEDAKKELDDYLGIELQSPKTFKFSTGYYPKPWQFNCVALGLASGFMEPLEGTSILITTNAITWLCENIDGILHRDQKSIDIFNKKYCGISEDSADFLYLHYLTKRNDTEYWRGYWERDMPEKVAEFVEYCRHRVPNKNTFEFGTVFPYSSWIQVGYEKGVIKPEAAKHTLQTLSPNIDYEFYKNNFMTNLHIDILEDHDKYLKYITS